MKSILALIVTVLLASTVLGQSNAIVDIGCTWDDPRAYDSTLLDNRTWHLHYGFYWWANAGTASGSQLKSYTWSWQSAQSFANSHSAAAVALASVPGYNGEPLAFWKVEISRSGSLIAPQAHSEIDDATKLWTVGGMAYGELQYHAPSFSWEPKHAEDRKLFLQILRQ